MAKKSKKTTSRAPLSPKKKALFYSITVSIPVLFFIVLELILRSVNYLGNTDLFMDPEIPTNEYLIPNPNFAARYFFYTKTIPNPSTDVFLRTKPENGFRVFAMGGSSAAGYPYGFNGTFSRVVNDVLQDAMPDNTVEVVNVGISAISSYTLFDQVDEIIEQDPDAILIYAGHNEFYGALGVGSNENLGGFPSFVRFYLKLQRFKTFMLLRTMIVDAGKWFSDSLGNSDTPKVGTLMERIVNSRSIELNSPKHQLAMIQFRSNIEAITKKFETKGIPVYIGSVASNIKDHTPFVNITEGEQPPALQVYDEAKKSYQEGSLENAAQKFTLAKDLDGLKFRAPSKINQIIKETTEEFANAHYVDVEEKLTESVEDGIIGFELMLEHLHPNQEGYFLIGSAFSETLISDFNLVPQNQTINLRSYKDRMYFSEFDHRVAWHRVTTLKQGFPFVMGEKPTPYNLSYGPISFSDSLALLTVHNGKRWDEAKVEIAQYFEKNNEKEKALLEYQGLYRNQPWNDSPYVFAARVFLDKNDFKSAEPLLLKAYEITSNDAYVTKMLGAIEVQKGNSKAGIQYLEKSRSIKPRDPQMLYNLSGAYGTDQQFEKALEIADQVIQINPNFPGIQAWKQQLQTIINQRKGN